jgi:antigen flippase
MINAALSLVRTKAIAVLLGPAGFGLFGIYGAISDLVRSLAGMGVNSSGVRQIAEAVGTDDQKNLACTVTVLRRVAFYFGALGALLLLAFSKQISRLTFGDDQHTTAVALLSIAVFFADVSAGQGAVLQGMRRIADLARMSVWGGIYGTVFSIVIVYFWKEGGVVPALVCIAAMNIVVSWWYARKVKVEKVSIRFKDALNEASALLKLGLVFMSSGFMTMGMAYLVKMLLTRRIGLESAGYYQAAWSLGNLYTGFVLQAMAADFYPRLTGIVNDHERCNRLVNEQVEIGLLLSATGVFAAITFAPLVIHILYSAKFEPAVELFRWICLGMMVRIATWPLGFVIVAKGDKKLFLYVELVSNIIYAGLIWAGVELFGLAGTGIAFFGSFVVNGIGLYIIIGRLSGFRWSGANLRVMALIAPLTVAIFVSSYVLSPTGAMIFGGAVTAMMGIYSVRTLCSLIPFEKFPQIAQKLLILLRLAPSSASVPGSE